MGTNYYIRYNLCNCCNRYDEIHIGKSSAGWQFSFHAVDDSDIKMALFDPKDMLDDTDRHLIISSFQDWKSFIEKYVIKYKAAKIYNEYDELQDPIEFFKLIEAKRKEENNQAKYVMKSESSYRYRGDYVDDEGYSFSPGDFS